MELLKFLRVEVESGFSGGKASHKTMTEITRNLSKEVTRLQDIGTSMEQEQQNVKASNIWVSHMPNQSHQSFF